jgi:hypothetical protein
MDGLSPRTLRNLDKPLYSQITLGGGRRADVVGLVGQPGVEGPPVRVRVDGHAGDLHLFERPDHAHGDLPTVRDQDLPEHL